MRDLQSFSKNRDDGFSFEESIPVLKLQASQIRNDYYNISLICMYYDQ